MTRSSADNSAEDGLAGELIYFGNLLPHEPQFQSGRWRGLALDPRHGHDIKHDAREPMPFADDSVPGFQSQDVFEHIEREKITPIFDDIYRCLRPGGLFRLSVPDYHAPLLRRRSVFDSHGRVLCDVLMGGSVANAEGGIAVKMTPGGGSHLWFPTYTQVLTLVLAS